MQTLLKCNELEQTRTLVSRDGAPTLISTSARHGRGVQVWRPRHDRLYGPTLLFGGVSILYTYECLAMGETSAILLANLAVLAVFFSLFIGYSLVTVRSVIQPCYVTTDEQGFGVTTRRYRSFFEWNEIEWLRTVSDIYQGFELSANGQVHRVDLSGYPQTTLLSLESVVVASADLQFEGGDSRLFVSRRRLQQPSTSRPELPGGQ